ncbi:MAG: hypothetical protein A2Y07_07145 [Planctomycetes bacterium GWF2_50_10]|nr:MAG: hypothetical protein A2Y07_07145 [Planctomycetes bacterium GWF2_50_10]
MKLALSVFCVVLGVSGGIANAETIVEKFTPATDFVVVQEPNSGSILNYIPTGYVQAVVCRRGEPNSVASFYVPLSQRYFEPNESGVSTVSQFWMGFDFQYLSTTGTPAAANIGIFNSDANNMSEAPHKYNFIGVCPYSYYNVSVRAWQNTTTGALTQTQEDASWQTTLTDTFRFRMRVYRDGNATRADFAMYKFDGSNNPVLMGAPDTGILLSIDPNSFMTGMNALGIRNAAGSYAAKSVKFNIDNMYFSTVSEVADSALGVPAWITPDNPVDLQVPDFSKSQDFDNIPTDWKSIGQINSGTSIGVDAGGYIKGIARRKGLWNSTGAYFTRPEARLFEPCKYIQELYSFDELYMAFDYKYVSGAWQGTHMIGLFNQFGTNNSAAYSAQNTIAILPLASDIYLRKHVNRNWSAVQESDTLVGTVSDPYGSYRYSLRVYKTDLKETNVNVSCFKYDASGNLNPAAEFTATVPIIGAVDPNSFHEGMDAFGVRNASGSTEAGPTTFYVDNMYVGTTAAPVMDKPSWFCGEADFNCDGAVNYADLKVITDSWLSTSVLDADLVENNRIDLADFAKFASYWLGL